MEHATYVGAGSPAIAGHIRYRSEEGTHIVSRGIRQELSNREAMNPMIWHENATARLAGFLDRIQTMQREEEVCACVVRAMLCRS